MPFAADLRRFDHSGDTAPVAGILSGASIGGDPTGLKRLLINSIFLMNDFRHTVLLNRSTNLIARPVTPNSKAPASEAARIPGAQTPSSCPPMPHRPSLPPNPVPPVHH